MTLPKQWNWKWISGTFALLAMGVLIQWRTWREIWNIACSDEESSQIFLVPLIAAYLIWVRRGRFRRITPRPSWIGPSLVAFGAFVNYYGQSHAYISLEQIGAVLIAIGCVVTVLGRQFIEAFLPALMVLAFLVPAPASFRQNISIPLERVTASVTQDLFDVLGIAVQRSGNLLSINGVDVTIAEACNGLRMVFALFLVSYLFAFSVPLRNYVRLIVIAASPLSAILCNVVRLIPTVWLYGHSSQETAEIFHDVSGWIMLPLAFALLVCIIRSMRWALLPIYPFTLSRE